MSAAALIKKLHDLGVRIKLESGELRVKAPKGVLTKELQLELKAAKQELIDFLSGAAPAAARLPAVKPAPADAPKVLSFPQQRLWFLDRLEPGNIMYNIPMVLRLKGELDVPALESAFNDLIARHEALRSNFITNELEEPELVIHEQRIQKLEVTEATDSSDEGIRALLEEFNRDAFDLADGPLIRLHLIRVSEDDHVLMLLMHHIISDAWSLNVISSELIALYSEHHANSPAGLKALPLQYSDYAYWQREHLSGGELDRQLNYWTERLKGAPAVIELPTDRTRPATPSYAGGRVQRYFSKETSDKLNALAQSEKATLFMVLLAISDLLLARYTGSDDIVVGTPIAGRERTELEGLIGFFINNLVMRTDVSGDPSFRELLHRTRDTALDAYAHQTLPFERLVEELQPERNLSHAPIFQVLFLLQNAPDDGGTFAGLESTGLGFDYGTAKFDLTIATIETGDGVAVEFEYNRDLFDHGTIERMIGHFGQLLEAVADNPDLALSEYRLLSDAEAQQLADWNNTDVAYPADATLPSLLYKQAASTPDAPAVRFGTEQISYRELDARSNQLAHYLAQQGVKAESLVGVCMDRSIDLVVTLHAIVKAGGAYVPMDPEYPEQRLQNMAEDAELSLLLSQQHLGEVLPGTERTNIEDIRDAVAACPSAAPDTAIDPAQAAYVIFTSGSTGRPKGVLNEHRGICNRLLWMQDEYQLDASDRVLQKTPFSFDVSVWEFFWPFISGAELVVAKPGGHRDSAYLAKLINDTAVTTLHFVPSMLQVFLQEEAAASCGSLRRVICSGEALPRELQNRFFGIYEKAELHNLYGPTEAAIDVSYWACQRGDDERSVPIGRPVANTKLYVVDPSGQQTPVGVAGELWISGIQVARGYVNRPELTAERFIDDPFNAGARVYRTGDLVRYRDYGTEGGAIEFLGRIDHQVKLRGFRIELGEIEATLDEHPQVDASAVIVREGIPGDKRLVGYVVGDTGPEALEQHLADTLPAYMVPSAFVFLDAIPLSPNGKLDRNALPAPDWQVTTEYVAPRDDLEQTIADIWSEVLGVGQVGINDDFFALGGHSLLATKATGRIRAALGRDVELRQIFTHPTVAGLAAALGTSPADSAAHAINLPGIPACNLERDIPLSWSQERLWFLDELEPGNAAYNIPWAARFRGNLNYEALQTALDYLVARHDQLRTVFERTVDGPVQHVAEGLRIVPKRENCSALSSKQINARLQELAHIPFDLKTGPLLRLHILETAEDDYTLLFVMHHIIADNWSIEVLQSELQVFYQGVLADDIPLLSAPELRYADYAVWQRESFGDDELKSQLDYWLTQLSDAPALLDIPTDKPRPAAQTYNGSGSSLVLDTELRKQLQTLAQQKQVTLFMLLLSAFDVLLSRYAGSEEIVVGTPISGRQHTELEGVVGIFLNTLAIAADTSGNPGFSDFLKSNKQTILDAYAHQDLPFEMLVDELQPNRDMSHSPVFQIMFTLNNQQNNQAESSSAEAGFEPVGFDYGTAKFDLNLSMTDSGDSLGAYLEYNSDLFNKVTIDAMLVRFRQLLKAIVAAPDTGIADLPLLSDIEQTKIITGFNDTATDYGIPRPVHQRVEQQARKTPDAIAVHGTDQALTYDTLNSRANALAAALTSQGVQRGQFVAISCERSVEMTIAVLAVLKAGATYVPVDPDYPAERIDYMLGDCGAVLLISNLAEPPAAAVPVLNLNDFDFAAGQTPDTPESGVTAADSAYAIYTSGSTGKPKGVVLTHAGLDNLIGWQNSQPGLDKPSRTLQFASLSFDVSFQELFTTWAQGGTVVMISEEQRKDLAALSTLIADKQIERLYMPYAALQPLAELLTDRNDLELKLQDVISAGEQLLITPALRKLFERSSARLHNQYGPSETHVVTALTLKGDSENWPALPGIGKPVGNTRCYILDAGGHPVPVGVPGELYLAGIQVARGYIGRDKLTAEKFIADPFNPDADYPRMYRTGDKARYLADGNIEFLGRIDDQVKFRGFRIEPGEIEAVLTGHPSIKLVAVTVPGTGSSQKLVAYAATESGATVDGAELRDYAKQHLPDYMVPTHFVILEELPLTPSGKVARRLLPEPEFERDAQQGFQAPETPTEESLCNIWSVVLDVAQPGVTDDFFELGGHSLLATRVIARIREQFGVELPLRVLFETPTIRQIAVAVQELSGTALPAIDLAARKPAMPLSFAQQRIWFLHELMPDNPLYNVPWVRWFEQRFDPELLQAAMDKVVERHESLRTAFINQDGDPVQHIRASMDVPVTFSNADSEQSLQQQLTEASRHLFDLEAGPSLIVRVIEDTASESCVLMVVMHHIISDAWSLDLLTGELLSNYRTLIAGNEISNEAPALQYVDYAVWQRDYLEGDALEQQLNFWRGQLAGAPAVLELPTDHPRPAVQSYAGQVTGRTLPAPLSDELRLLSANNGATLYMTLLTAFQTLLARYSGQDDIVIGTPVSGRNQTGLEEIIGLFLNTLVIRGDLSDRPDFSTLIRRTRRTVLDAFAHQDLPFERLVEALQPVRDMSVSPLFQVMLTLQKETAKADAEMYSEAVGYEYNSAKFDLNVSVSDQGEGRPLGIVCEYATDLFEQSTVDRMLAHFENLLVAIINHPTMPLAELPMLGQAEQQQILHRWNDTARNWQTAGTLHGLVEAQCARSPDATAVVFGKDSLSYAELEQQSGDLARMLVSMGAGPDVPVAVCLDRSADMLVCMLAVLRAGSGYVPLDPNYPADRIAYMLEDSRAQVLLTESKLIDVLPADQVQAVCVDDPLPSVGHIDLPETTGTEHLAYQIYTSGSTGKPKGVQIEHQAVVNFLNTMAEEPGFTAGDKLLAVTTLCFDISILELFLPLIVGGTVVIASQEQTADGLALSQLLDVHDITVMQATPATWRLMQQAGWSGHSKLKVLCGGEALERELADSLIDGNAALWNMYGPTETTIWSTCHSYQNTDPVITVGAPIANTLVYVLDDSMQPLPAGVPGELYIGGDGVARGYWQRDELNAERFLPNPFDEGRIYRTGDRVRWRHDGTLEVLGRTDFQVKLRGFRIELGEIETALASHQDVTQAVVILREDTPGDKRLVAYCIAPDGVSLSPAGLRDHISDDLPDYMLPTAFVQLERYPLTPNGKIDRKALPAPDSSGQVSTDYVAPRNAQETAIAELWAEILDVEQVGIKDNFFTLGGHSLLATRLVGRMQSELGLDVPLRAVFEQATIEGLSIELGSDTDGEAATVTALQPIETADRSQALALSPNQVRFWFLDQLDPGSPVYNLPWNVELESNYDAAVIEAALHKLAERHEVLRTNFVEGDSGPELNINSEPAINLEVAEIADRDILTKDLELLADTRFDLASGPLLRARLYALEDGAQVLALVLHHIIADGWSFGVLFDELDAICMAIAAGQEPQLPFLPIQFTDYAQWQTNSQNKLLGQQLEHWSEHLRDAPPLLELPTDYPRPPEQSYRGAHFTRYSGNGMWSNIEALAREAGATPFMVLLTAYNVLLARYAGQDDVVVGIPVAGRQRPEANGLIGLFLNTLPLRTRLNGAPSFRELLGRVKASTLDAFANQDVPFEKLVEHLQPERNMSHTPLYQAMFNLRNDAGGNNPDEGSSRKVVNPERSYAKTDLTFTVAQWEQDCTIDVEYSTDLFDADSIELMLAHYIETVVHFCEHPDAEISSPPLGGFDERLSEPDDTHTGTHTFNAATLGGEFETQVQRTPDATAVVTATAALSYAELNARANGIARQLVAITGSEASTVALLLPHDEHMISGILGTLKAGHAYVPLDPYLPAAQLSERANQGRVSAVVTTEEHKALAEQIAAELSTPVVFADSAEPVSNNPPVNAKGASLAYILFTSGSTGTPKGVMQVHRAVLQHAETYANSVAMQAEDRVVQFANYSFDASVMDIYGALLTGACLYPVDLRQEESVAATRQMLADNNISIFHSTPTVYRHLFGDATSADVPASIRAAVLGGEETRATDVEIFNKAFPANALFVNGLGPSESTMALQYFADQSTRLLGQKVPVGLPVPGTEVFLLDDGPEGDEKRSGICGELCFESPWVSPGYWDPDTGASVIDEQSLIRPRIYRSGDHAKYLPNGDLVFTGRRDGQIKIRGYRVELGEIENALLRVTNATQVAAGVFGSGEDAKVVGYVEADELDTPAVLAALRDSLPGYMVPATVVALSELPRTATGKVLRKALPEPDAALLGSRSGEYAAPENDTEAAICAAFAKVLKLDEIGRNDNFFDAGGHSLLATTLLAAIREQLGAQMKLRDVFDSPTPAGLAEALTVATSGTESAPLIEIVPRDKPLPVSFQQERLWFLDRMMGSSNNYNIAWGLSLKGLINTEALQQAADALALRHEVLRTSFAEGSESDAVQIIQAEPALHVQHHDARGLNETDLRQRVSELAAETFDLTSAPLLRIHHLELADDQHTLVFVMHHIISDGWSVNIAGRDFSQLYQQFADNTPAKLPKLTVAYADYAAWQRSWYTGERLDEQVDYWKAHLQNAPTLLELPTDRPRPLTQTYNGHSLYFSLDSDLSKRLTALAAQHNVTVFMLLLAAFNVLMARLSGSDDIVIGTPVAGRKHTSLNELIGFFVNTLAIRSDLSDNPRFSDLLTQTKQNTLNAFDHQDLPFEKLVEELNPERNRSHSPVFQVAFILQNTPSDEAEFAGLEAQTYPLDGGTSKFDLTVACWEATDTIGGLFQYNTDLFDEATVSGFSDSFSELLKEFAAQPEQRVWHARTMPDATAWQVTFGWNETEASYPRHDSIAAQFDRIAAQHGDATALVCRDEVLSYSDLNTRANQLAHYLIQQGVERGHPVAMCLDRSIEAVVTVLAILKAGGAYVPLDPAYPADRLEFMLQDSGVKLMLTHSDIELDIEPGHARRINLNIEADSIAKLSGEPAAVETNGDDLAYIIYTSGSTGRPKGTLIEQHSVLRLVLNTNYGGFGPDQSIAMLAPISFDASTYEMWGSLLNGGRSVIYPEKIPTIDSLAGFLKQSDVSQMFMTTALFNAVIDTNPKVFKGIEQIFVGGEALSIDHIRRAMTALPDTQFNNIYGPTESTTYATTYPVPRDLDPDAGSLPIGAPISNTTCYVLDEYMNPVAPGVHGELYLGGDGLARGYLNQPELTAEKFVANPFSSNPADRLYRTGDLVHWRRDGNIEYIGRIDNQVKLRGFRIELDEIAEVLRKHPDVTNAAVIMAGDTTATKRLIAYLVSGLAEDQLNETLSGYLRDNLPEFMIPAAYVALDSIPLTANGKLDRRALPQTEFTPTGSEQVAPRTVTETTLQELWKELLQTDEVGVTDDFFALGGHSILTIKLIKLVQDATGKTLQVSDVFERPTIEGLAALLDGEAAANHTPQALVPLNTQGEAAPLFVLGKQVLGLEHYLGNDRPLYLLDRSYYTGFEPRRAVIATAEEYLSDITATVAPGDINLAAFGHHAAVIPELAKQLGAAGYTLKSTTLIDPPPVVTKGKQWEIEKTHYKVGATGHLLYRIYRNADTPPGFLKKSWDALTAQQSVNSYLSTNPPQPLPGTMTIIRSKSGHPTAAFWTHYAYSKDEMRLLDLSSENHESSGLSGAEGLAEALKKAIAD